MAELSRGPDYLRLHANVRQRVRNLETGVHPTGTHLGYYDTYPPTVITVRAASAWEKYETGGAPYPRWQRRTGLVMLSGSVLLKSSSSLPADDWLATLPPEAAPLQDLTVQISSDQSPFRTRITVKANGELHLLKDNLVADPRPVVWFDGAMWAVN